jgi:phospholipase C
MAGAAALLGPEMLDQAALARSDEMADQLARFDYVVVLMLENRSFDNMLGYLYQDDPTKPFNGVYGKQLSNPIPPNSDKAYLGVLPVTQGVFPENPCPDPGEEYPRVNTQIFGTVSPPANAAKSALFMQPPYNLPSGAAQPLMNGFVQDYISNFQNTVGRAPTFDEYKVVMDCFAPDTVPVISTLAKQFAVCDNWFCSVPTQTFANRSFFHAATSSGLVLNAPYADWIVSNKSETIFERMATHGLNWKVYFDVEDVIPVTAAIHYGRLQKFLPTNFFRMDKFYADVAEGTLPRYSFIEPRMFRNHNDAHPPAILGNALQHSSVLASELLIHEIYSAIRDSNNQKGSNSSNTLFVITFDEHGGCYDHVPPPAVTPPDATRPAGQMGFRFDRLGLRVPTVLVSAHIPPGMVYSSQLDHSSLMKTMSLKWNLGSLTERDRTAPDFASVFSLDKPRQREEWPQTTPRVSTQVADTISLPLNHLQSGIFQTVQKIAQSQGLTLPNVATIGEALFHMKRVIPTKH